ncbi:MAG TPA: alpha/beta hydrolase [Candidatus Aquilonibacter sp.]
MRRNAFLAATTAAVFVPTRASARETRYDLVTSTGTISGTLLLPDGAAQLVLIIAGSGPTDRDGDNPLGLYAASYRRLADALMMRGIASVRYDKRGIAASRAAGSVPKDLRFEMYVSDAAAWIAKLRGDGRFPAIAVAGHSEGSLIGMMAVQHEAVAAYVSIAGPGFPASVLMRRQLGARFAHSPELAAANTRILDALVRGRTVSDVPTQLLPIYNADAQQYIISWIRYDPRVEIVKVRAPVTIVQGGNDIQVGVGDATALAAARPDAKLVIIPKMTHVLSDDDATAPAAQMIGVYRDPTRPIDPQLVRAIAASLG